MASPVMLRGFGVITESLDALAAYLRRKGVSAASLVGLAADRRQTFGERPSRPGQWRAYVPKETS